MVRQFAMLFFILSFPTLLFAQLETTLNFNGELQDSLKIDGLLSVIRPVTIQVPGTCVRQVPHQENVCRDVTRYRQECHNVPSSQSCSTQYDNVCHPLRALVSSVRPALLKEFATKILHVRNVHQALQDKSATIVHQEKNVLQGHLVRFAIKILRAKNARVGHQDRNVLNVHLVRYVPNGLLTKFATPIQ
jgi:hypothetical protein